MAYFVRTGATTFEPTTHVGGAWTETEQHIAPALGLLAHAVERDRDTRRGGDLALARLSYDILGTLPLETVELDVRVLRPGRTIELVEGALSHRGRPVVLLRAWLMRTGDTAAVTGTGHEPMPGPHDLPRWNPSSVWPGGFIASAEVRRQQCEPGRARFWVRSAEPLIEGEAVSPTSRAAGLFDIANGMTARADPAEIGFPNIDLTAHLCAQPQGEWLGFDTAVTFGGSGIGITSSVLHDRTGVIGTLAQILTLRPRVTRPPAG